MILLEILKYVTMYVLYAYIMYMYNLYISYFIILVNFVVNRGLALFLTSSTSA